MDEWAALFGDEEGVTNSVESTISESASPTIATSITNVNTNQTSTAVRLDTSLTALVSGDAPERRWQLWTASWTPTGPTATRDCTRCSNCNPPAHSNANQSSISTANLLAIATNRLTGYPLGVQPRFLNPAAVLLCVFRTFGLPWRAIARTNIKEEPPRNLIRFYYSIRRYRLPEWVYGSSRRGMDHFAGIVDRLRFLSPPLALSKVHFLWLLRYGLKFDWTWTIKCFRKVFPWDITCRELWDDDWLMARVVIRIAKDLNRVEKIIEDIAKWLERGEEEAPEEVVGWLKEFGDGRTIEMLRREVIGRFVFEADNLPPHSAPAPSPPAPSTAISDRLRSYSDARSGLFVASYADRQSEASPRPGGNRVPSARADGPQYRELPRSEVREVLGDPADLPPGTLFEMNNTAVGMGGRGFQPNIISAIASDVLPELRRIFQPGQLPHPHNGRASGATGRPSSTHPRVPVPVQGAPQGPRPGQTQRVHYHLRSLSVTLNSRCSSITVDARRDSLQGVRFPYPPRRVHPTSTVRATAGRQLVRLGGLPGALTLFSPSAARAATSVLSRPLPIRQNSPYRARPSYLSSHSPRTFIAPSRLTPTRPAPPTPRPAVALVDGQYIMVPNPQVPTAGTPPTEWRRGRYAWAGSPEAEERSRLISRLLP
ncbi:hypothetical protein FGG08_003324 [Glutinoglossum americanum]|uniref:Uncharacterized protein n=1 Tax=Glutinoglossum americanum TaxID=1670608 RepID=A0A9P8L3P3_9PEZI|nr:hypothetical protein FGG08_003324 [Glutinoglossum americanum]